MAKKVEDQVDTIKTLTQKLEAFKKSHILPWLTNMMSCLIKLHVLLTCLHV
jgi:hypothetical protein